MATPEGVRELLAAGEDILEPSPVLGAPEDEKARRANISEVDPSVVVHCWCDL